MQGDLLGNHLQGISVAERHQAASQDSKWIPSPSCTIENINEQGIVTVRLSHKNKVFRMCVKKSQEEKTRN